MPVALLLNNLGLLRCARNDEAARSKDEAARSKDEAARSKVDKSDANRGGSGAEVSRPNTAIKSPSYQSTA